MRPLGGGAELAVRGAGHALGGWARAPARGPAAARPVAALLGDGPAPARRPGAGLCTSWSPSSVWPHHQTAHEPRVV